MQNLVVQKGSNDLHICNVYLIQMYTFDLYICIPNFDKHVFGPNTVFGQLFPSPESPTIASAPPKKKIACAKRTSSHSDTLRPDPESQIRCTPDFDAFSGFHRIHNSLRFYACLFEQANE